MAKSVPVSTITLFCRRTKFALLFKFITEKFKAEKARMTMLLLETPD